MVVNFAKLRSACLLATILFAAAYSQAAEQQEMPLVVKAAKCGDKEACELGDRITVSVDKDSLSQWTKAGNDPKKLVLILNGRMLKGVYGDPPSDGKEDFKFDLKRLADNEENRKAWNALLSRAKAKTSMTLSVGLENKPVSYGEATFTLVVFPWYSPWVIVSLVLLLAIFLYLAHKSDIIRDPGPEPQSGKRRYFSLARTQMAWWFFIVVASYLYIWMVTGDRDTLPSGVLVLIGISAATGLGAMVVDSSKQTEKAKQIEDLEKELAALKTRISELEKGVNATPSPPNLSELQKELQEKTARRTTVETELGSKKLAPASEGFLKDLLSDEGGVSFHRFQILVWTLVLGLVFVVAVYKDLAMPDFSTTLLGLVGVSSGTYIGFKLPTAPQ